MRDSNPGDLSVRLTFGQVLGSGAGAIRPTIAVTDGTSGCTLEIELTPEQLTAILSGSAAEVTADKVSGFLGIQNWGKRHELMTRTVKTQQGDWLPGANPRKLPHVAAAVQEVEDAGYRTDRPRRNNAGMWVVIGRRYV